MRKIENCELKFKLDLSNIELFGIEKMIDSIDEDVIGWVFPSSADLGLAYTSSSAYAMYNITNDFYMDDNELASHLSITENNMLILVAYDEDDKEVFYEIENTDLF
jgi:hypothetical protein